MAAIRTIMNARFISVLAIALDGGIAVATVEAQRREIRGRITDMAGAGRSGVSVDLIKDGATIRSTVSGDDGRFRLDVVELSEGVFDVRIVVPGFAPQVVRLTPNPQPVVASVDGLRIEVRADTL